MTDILRRFISVAENREKSMSISENSTAGNSQACKGNSRHPSCRRLRAYILQGIPPSVAINEAVELAKSYDDEKRRLINGITNSIAEACGAKARQSKSRKSGKPRASSSDKDGKKGEVR